MQLRIGNGYDMHRLVPGRPLILGGQRLEHPDGLGLDLSLIHISEPTRPY